jgi:hypothetical protein
MKLQLVDDAREWKRWWSMRWIIVGTAFASGVAAFVVLPPTLVPHIPDWLRATLAMGTVLSSIAAGVSRVLKQP